MVVHQKRLVSHLGTTSDKQPLGENSVAGLNEVQGGHSAAWPVHVSLSKPREFPPSNLILGLVLSRNIENNPIHIMT
jgi:hypothetical protein